MGLPFMLCNVLLGQLALIWQVIKIQSKKKYTGKINFTSLTGCDLNFPINFGHAASQFLTAKTVQKIQIVACETNKMHCLQTLFFLDFKL